MSEDSAPIFNGTNATLEAQLARQALLELCERYQLSPYVYIAFAPIWLAALAEWLHSVCYKHASIANDLHRLLLWVPTIELLCCTFNVGYFWTCPWDHLIEQMVGACWIIVTILKEPVMLVCLLMVAKGWRTTRERLSPREVYMSAVIVGLLYASVVVQFAIAHWAALVPMLLMWLLMLINVVGSTLTNLRFLKAQLIALRTFNIDATTTPVYTKYLMFRSLLASTAAYYLLDLALFLVAYQRLIPPWASAICRQSLEAGTALLIGRAFRARPLNAMFEQVQQLAVDLAGDLLPQISTVTIDVSALRGDGTVPWSRSINLRDGVQPSTADLITQPKGAGPPDLLLVLNPADDLSEGEGVLAGGTTRAVSRALVVAIRDAAQAGDDGSGSGSGTGGRGIGGGRGVGSRGGTGSRATGGGGSSSSSSSNASGHAVPRSVGSGGRLAVPMTSLRQFVRAATPWDASAEPGTGAARSGRSGGDEIPRDGIQLSALPSTTLQPSATTTRPPPSAGEQPAPRAAAAGASHGASRSATPSPAESPSSGGENGGPVVQRF